MTGHRGRLGAYLAFQARDFLLLRAALPTVLVLMFGWMMVKTAPGGIDWAAPVPGQRFLAEIVRVLSGMFITLAAFLGVARLVTDDRSNGYFRFLFSKPVSVVQFYGQQWLLTGAGLVVLAGGLALLLGAVTAPVNVVAIMTVMGLTWMLVGGVGFALSAATNYDAALLVIAYVVSSALHAFKDAPGSTMAPWLQQLTRLTMPLHRLDYVRDELYAGNPMPWGHAAIVAGYGAAFAVAAVVILRRVSLSR
ncbi:MAG: hypothetical protein U9Q74_11245 [Gemmatimonadota bacterium]|nr:hypothetical protein [Gemmatimonadota bacterium]